LRESRGARRPLDLPGMALVALGLAALVDAVVEAPARGWGAPRTLALLAAGAVALVGFVVWERYTAAPMIPPRLLRLPAFAAANVANMFSSAATFSAAFVMSQYFQFGRGDSPLGTGLRFLPWTAMPLLVAPLAGAWCDRIGARRLAVPGLILQAAGFVAIVVLAGTGQSWAAYVGPFVVAGVGVSLALPTLPTAAMGAIPASEIGIAAGVVNTVQRIGPVIGVAVASAVFAAHGSLASAAAVTSGFRWALGASAMLSLIGAAVAATIGRRRTAVEG
ncbi:MAG TPA: MFS transporter, partial [Micromonosporaceae bacterium]